MTTNSTNATGWLNYRLAIRVKWILVAVIMVPLFFMYLLIASSPDDNVALTRNEVVEDGAGGQTWFGRFDGSSEHPYFEVAATIRFLDKNGQPVGETSASDDLFEPGESLALQAPLPAGAESIQVYSLQWRMRNKDRLIGRMQSRDYLFGELLGPWGPWAFGYLQREPPPSR